MAYVKLGTKEVGSIIKIKVNGEAKDFIIVHQGLPSSAYDASCNGVWVIMKDVYTDKRWDDTSNDYPNSDITAYLNGTFISLIDTDICNAIKQVKIPYAKYSNYNVMSGSNGLSCKVFLLSGKEVGFSGVSYMTTEGAKLSYFDSASKRVAYKGSRAGSWWLRSPDTSNTAGVLAVKSDGSSHTYGCVSGCGVRPAFILPSTLLVSSDDGTVSVNTAPAVTTDGTGAALGEKNTAFAWKYTVTDADGDTLTVTEKLDGKTTKTRTGVASGTDLTFEQTADAAGFQRVLNGSHTMTVEVSDGKEAASTSATFTKAVHAASVTLTDPLAVDGDITVAVLQVTGSIPDDAVFKVEATNNAKDAAPVWQDVTADVQKGVNIVFSNKTAANGAAFNFRISVSRGASGTGGYIDAVSGAFE